MRIFKLKLLKLLGMFKRQLRKRQAILMWPRLLMLNQKLLKLLQELLQLKGSRLSLATVEGTELSWIPSLPHSNASPKRDRPKVVVVTRPLLEWFDS